jgi:carboxypeptidase Taq
MNEQSASKRLHDLFHRLNVLGEAVSALRWDMATMMPEGGADARAEQLATLKSMTHELITQPGMEEWLARAAEAAEASGDPWEVANIREMRRDWVHAACLPARLVEARVRAESACEMVWREARPKANWAMVLPSLRALFALVREAAEIKAEALGVSRYDALLDQFEPGGRSGRIDQIFADLEQFLPAFLPRALEAQAARPVPVAPRGPFPTESQKALGMRLMADAGFDFRHGRLDASLHPFCGGYRSDVRITTRYDQADFTSALMGVLHETGHALYEAGLPGGHWRHQPVSRSRGMVVHEGQSLLLEMQACRSREFMAYAAPLMKAAFDGAGPEWEAENLYRLGTRVEPDFIRVEADEVTYPAHVIIRYRLERALVEGAMELDDLPEAWEDGYRRLLGITPPDHRLGVLQDIHWYCGLFGYFPTYTLGAMTAAQLFDAAKTQVPDVVPGLGRGDFRPLMTWLGEHVHSKGSLLSTDGILEAATGRGLDVGVFKAHLERRYLS